jgi:hypothetical protein
MKAVFYISTRPTCVWLIEKISVGLLGNASPHSLDPPVLHVYHVTLAFKNALPTGQDFAFSCIWVKVTPTNPTEHFINSYYTLAKNTHILGLGTP